MLFQARRCGACGLRFPVQADSALGDTCPSCGAPTERVDAPYATHQVTSEETRSAVSGPPIEVLLDNVRSVRNVGSMFRTADGAGVRHLHLAGFTPTPEHAQMAKTALGAERSVAWTRYPDALGAAHALSEAGHHLWALEGGPRAESLFDVASEIPPDDAPAVVLVLGHEVSGVDPRILRMCERVVSIPMEGTKGSLNVGVAFGVAVYTLRHAWRLRASLDDPGV
jgi:tRNA G18 (ribose-2'-O)-methylase SpoU